MERTQGVGTNGPNVRYVPNFPTLPFRHAYESWMKTRSIYEKSGVPGLAHMFKHALTHDVAYESVLVQRRKQRRHTIGLAIAIP